MTKRVLGNCILQELTVRGDERGSLVAIEGGRDVPFNVARVYFVFGTKAGVDRGYHAHLKLQQLAVCVSGSCTMVLDDGNERVEVRLDRPSLGLSIGPMIWREMRNFSEDCVLMVLASAPYDPVDYISDYKDFVSLVRSSAC